MLRNLSIACLALTSIGVAQAFTSPKGYLTAEAASNHNYMLFSKYEMYWQAIDKTQIGAGTKVMREVAWRRDGTGASSAFAARTMTNWEMSIGKANYGLHNSVDISKNALAGTFKQVVKPTTLNVIDISAPPTTAPAPWTTVVKFDTPFIYDGADALLWEVRYSTNTLSTNYSFDATTGGNYAYTTSTASKLGSACTVRGNTSPISWSTQWRNYGTGFSIYHGTIANLPLNSPAFLWIDFADANLSVPVACTTIHALPTIVLPLGVSDASGSLAAAEFPLPYVQSAVGANLYGQVWAFDPGRQSGLPMSFSDGARWTIPADPTTPHDVVRNYRYKTTSTSTTTISGPWTGGLITRFQ